MDEADTTCLPFLQLFIKALNRNNPELNIIVIAYQYPHVRSEYKWFGNHIISLNAQKGILRKPFELVRLWRILKRLYRAHDITGIFSLWLGEYVGAAKWFSKIYNKKQLCWLIGQDVRKGNPFVNLIRPKPGELVAMSDFIAAELNRNYDIMPAHIVPNGIEPSLFSTDRPVKDIDISGAGSLIPLKQYNIFIDVVNDLKKDIPNIKAFLAGKGPEEEKLRIQIASLGLENNIELSGEKQHTAVLEIMQRTKVFLHPSSYEGFSTVCLEALYAGAHVISFINPMKERIRNWHVVNSKDEMTKTVIEILNNEQTVYKPIIFRTMEETAKSIIELFGQ